MNFDEWYENNKEVLTTKGLIEKLKAAFTAGQEVDLPFCEEDMELIDRIM